MNDELSFFGILAFWLVVGVPVVLAVIFVRLNRLAERLSYLEQSKATNREPTVSRTQPATQQTVKPEPRWEANTPQYEREPFFKPLPPPQKAAAGSLT